jgi:hypothetical protein
MSAATRERIERPRASRRGRIAGLVLSRQPGAAARTRAADHRVSGHLDRRIRLSQGTGHALALDTVTTVLAGEPDIDRVVFCCFSGRDREIYERTLAGRS